ncbi:MAG: NAD(P)H-dependent oxidoreductase subunit E [Bdellovibrionota bacterium]
MITFSEQSEKQFQDIVSRYPRKDAALLPVLWLAQHEFSVLTPEVRAYVAQKLDVSLARVESVISFYTMYNTGQYGTCHVQVCRNISCQLRGGQEVLSAIEQELGIKAGQTTEDGRYTLSAVECMGACGGAPAMQINLDPYIENLTPEKAQEEIRKVKREHNH